MNHESTLTELDRDELLAHFAKLKTLTNLIMVAAGELHDAALCNNLDMVDEHRTKIRYWLNGTEDIGTKIARLQD